MTDTATATATPSSHAKPSSFTRLKRMLPPALGGDAVIVPVVRIAGAIGAVGPFRQGVTLASLAGPLKKAFAMRGPAVAITINSPGGSPVQSHLIFGRIRALAEESGKTVIVAVEDVAASGGYLIALAGDEILVDPSSIVGSIGVVSAGFGFVGLLDRLGIERRVHTAGENKAMLDPFQPERESDVVHLKALQRDVHDMFIHLVRTRRGARLVEDPALFTGAFWSGLRGVELGLVDRVGDLRSALRARYGERVVLRPVGGRRGLVRSLVGGRLGHGSAMMRPDLAQAALAAVEERALWARYGL
ncbi:signal peptide peptidase SppA [Prosthecomicrobium pneumaticum]|uniref:Signal peptide peptidase SppA n=2 Tax=Prosthecomicrobium pneumaticum TaxID=81895 RepID=A0A7W9FL20_9HYPH|nr:signal peptide peptidase SppA [Prosthecomicrobium pneumaticum]